MLLIAGATAVSGTNIDEFKFTDRTQKSSILTVTPQNSEITIVVLNTNDAAPTIYNLTINFSKVPNEVTLKDSPKKKVSFMPGVIAVDWSIESPSESITLNLTDSFDILSWDDSVAIVGIKVNNQTISQGMTLNISTGELVISGITDNDDLCQKAFGSDFCQEYIQKCKNVMGECVTNLKITVNGVLEDEIGADKDGGFSSKKIEVAEGLNEIKITATDPGRNTNTFSFKVRNRPTTINLIEGYLPWIILAILAIIIIVWLVLFIRSRRKKKLEKEREYEEKKERRIELREKIAKMEQKEAYVGLNENQQAKKKSREIEEANINEELSEDPRFQKELKERAKKAVKQAGEGIPSEEIRDQMVEEGYTQEDIEIIKKEFKKLKGEGPDDKTEKE